MSTPLISVIIPVYNVEKYIDECVASVCRQTYQKLDIILVDDGSTDSSSLICDDWSKRDARVRVFHKENGGLSDARNFGLDRILGAYIAFVDSDDVLSPNAIEIMNNIREREDTDVVICEVHHFKESPIRYKRGRNLYRFDPPDAVAEMLYQTSFLVSAWGKLYKRDCYEDIRFPAGLLFEDSATLYKVLEKADSIAYFDGEVYGYRHRADSITTRSFDERDLDILKICEDIKNHYSTSGELLQAAARSYEMSAMLRVYLNAPRMQFSEQIRKCEIWITQNCSHVLHDSRVRKKTKIALLLFRFCRPLLHLVYSKKQRWS